MIKIDRGLLFDCSVAPASTQGGVFSLKCEYCRHTRTWHVQGIFLPLNTKTTVEFFFSKTLWVRVFYSLGFHHECIVGLAQQSRGQTSWFGLHAKHIFSMLGGQAFEDNLQRYITSSVSLMTPSLLLESAALGSLRALLRAKITHKHPETKQYPAHPLILDSIRRDLYCHCINKTAFWLEESTSNSSSEK